MTYWLGKSDDSSYQAIRKLVKARGRLTGVFYAAVAKAQGPGSAGIVIKTFARDPGGSKTLKEGRQLRKVLGTQKIARGIVRYTDENVLEFVADHSALNLRSLKRQLWKDMLPVPERAAGAGVSTRQASRFSLKLGKLLKKSRFVNPQGIEDPEPEEGVEEDDGWEALTAEDLAELGLDEVEIEELTRMERTLVRELDILEQVLSQSEDQAALEAAGEAEEAEVKIRATANDLRRFTREVILRSAGEHDTEQADRIREALAQQEPPRILAYIAAGGDMEALLEKAELSQLPPSMVQTLKHLSTMPPGPLVEAGPDALLEMSVVQRHAVLSLIPDPYFFDLADKVNTGLNDAKFSDSEEIRLLLDPDTGFDLSQVPAAFADFFIIVLTKYFDRLEVDAKRQIMSDVLGAPLGASVPEKLAAVLNGAGPAVQKLFQLAGEDIKSPDLDATMRSLKNNVRHFPTEEAHAAICAAYDVESVDEVFDDFGTKPIAAATIGQVYLARLKGGQDVVVKVRRPGIAERARREMALLKELAPGEGMRLIVERLEDSLMEEVDFEREGANLESALDTYYKPRRGIYPIGLASPDLPVTEDILVMDRAPGTSMDKVADKHLGLKARALRAVLKHWFEEAIFGSGFFHGDLHAGNLFLNPERAYKVVERTDDLGRMERIHKPYGSGPAYQCTLIDFGNVGQLSEQQQDDLLDLMMQAAFPKAEELLEAMARVMDLNETQRDALLAFIEAQLDKAAVDSELLLVVMNKAIELQVPMPKGVILFHRGRSFLDRQITHLNARLDKVDPKKKIKRYDPFEILEDVVKRKAKWKGFKAWWHHVF